MFCCITNDAQLVTKKEWTLTEWLSAFLEAELEGWDDAYEGDDFDGAGGDDYLDDGDDIDSDILESLIILALSGALAFLLYYRGQRQRREEERRRREELQRQVAQAAAGVDVGAAGQQQPAGEGDRGVFPHPEHPEFMDWVAGGVGH